MKCDKAGCDEDVQPVGVLITVDSKDLYIAIRVMIRIV